MSNINNALNLLQNNIVGLPVPSITSPTLAATIHVARARIETQRAERGETRPTLLMGQSLIRESIQSDSRRQFVHDVGANALLSTASGNSNTGPIPPHSIDNGITSLLQAVEQGQEERVKALMSPANINLHDAFGQTALMVAVAKGQIAIVELLLNAGAKTDVYIQISRQSAEGTLKNTPLILAARHGHNNILKLLLKNGADKEARDNEERTALHHAITTGHTEIVKLLIHAGASREARSRQGNTCLMLAAYYGHKEIVEFFLEKSADIEARDDDERTALYYAITRGCTEIVQLLIHAGASREARSRQGQTCLMLAAGYEHKEIVEIFLEKSADIEARDDEERTALHHAIDGGNTEIVQLLIHAGASREARSRQGHTCLMLAARYGHKEIVEFFLEKSADIEARDDEERTALHHAINGGNTEIVKRLIDAGASREVRNRQQQTLLMLAVNGRHREIVKLLLEEGVDKEARDSEGLTALHHAITRERTEIVQLLIDADPNINARNCNGETPLEMAVSTRNSDLVTLLIRHGADVNICDSEKCGILAYAVCRMDPEMVRLLLIEGANGCKVDSKGHTAVSTARMLHTGFSMRHANNEEPETVRKMTEILRILANTPDRITGMTTFMTAAKEGDYKTAETLVRYISNMDVGANALLSTASGNSNRGPIPAHYSIDNGIISLLQAVEQGQEEMVKALMSPANINAHDAFGQTALMVAVAKGQIAIVKLLLNAGAKIDVYTQVSRQSAEGPLKNTPLILAARHGHNNIIKLLLKNGADKEARDSEGLTALQNAIWQGHTEIVQLLIDAGASLEEREGTKYTLLTLAARQGYREIVKLLLENGAEEGIALYHAIAHGDTKIVKVLIDAGASREVRNRQQQTLLMLAVNGRHREIVKLLLEEGVDKEARDSEGLTALYHAIRHSDTEIVELLINADPNINARNCNGETPLKMAVSTGNSRLVTLLIRHGADVNICDSEECGILAHAVRRMDPEVVRLLLIEGADGFKVDSKGDTAVSIARSIHTEVSTHHASRGNAEAKRNIREILRILANTPDRITGMTTFMTAAKKGDYETAETLARYTSNRDVDVRMGGNLALENGHVWTARQLYKMINTPVNNVRFRLQYRGAQFNHRVCDNILYLDVDRQKMDMELARKYLCALSRYLIGFKEKSSGQFGDLSLNIKFTNEEGIDEGGLTAEFITLLFTTLFAGEHPFSLFTKSENGTYLLGFEEENPSFTANDSRRCKDLGILLAAIFSGFPECPEGYYYKIPTIFPNHFYKQLLAVCKYTADKELVPFEEMTPEDKEAFTKLVSDNDLDNEYYKNIDHNFEKQTYDDRELTQILHFIIIDYMECKEEDKAIYGTLQGLLEQSLAIPGDPIKLIHMQLDAERNDQYGDLNMQLRSTLRALLAENTFSADLKKRFVVSREERYAHVCTALAMVGQGFIHADQDFIAVMKNQFERDPLTAAEKLAVCIQGEPITHEAFVKLLKRSIVDDDMESDDSTAIEQKIAWLTEWCETGVYSMDGGQERQATIEEIRAVLHCIIGSSTITNQIFFTFAEPVNGMSEFHTCTHTVNFGSLALRHGDKIAFIEAWMEHVHSALDAGEFTIA